MAPSRAREMDFRSAVFANEARLRLVLPAGAQLHFLALETVAVIADILLDKAHFFRFRDRNGFE